MNRFPLRCITAKNPRFLVATGPEGFEPPTTWLKARRSTELSYEPNLCYTDQDVQHYNNAKKLYKHSAYIRTSIVPDNGMLCTGLRHLGKFFIDIFQAQFVGLQLRFKVLDRREIIHGDNTPRVVYAA